MILKRRTIKVNRKSSAKYLLTKRLSVEPVLGTLINFMGLRRIWTRGLKSANKLMLGAAIAYNLKKWMNYPEQKRKTAVMRLKMAEKASLFFAFMLCCAVVPYSNYQSKTFCQLLK